MRRYCQRQTMPTYMADLTALTSTVNCSLLVTVSNTAATALSQKTQTTEEHQ